MKKSWLILLGLPLWACGLEKEPRTMPNEGIDKALMGQILFFDRTLSVNGTQNCASCHNPDHAFIDTQGIVSEGAKANHFGKRNAPTMLYAKFSPDFHFDSATQEYIGGQFWDGRATNLAHQATMPILDPNEMAMPSDLSVAHTLYNNPIYYALFSRFYGEEVWQSVESIMQALQDALATFQQSKALLAPFDAKYDRFLQGKVALTALEEQGRQLFFDKNQTNCSLCHQAEAPQSKQETFSNYHYYNLGVPTNHTLIAHNKLAENFVDLGLYENPQVKQDAAQKGKFKTPTLRNVAVTAPYMHNGSFQKLKTVLLFLDSYNNPARKLNPETNKAWQPAEYAATIAHSKLKAKPLSDQEIEALEAFLNTLTDERYQPKP